MNIISFRSIILLLIISTTSFAQSLTTSKLDSIAASIPDEKTQSIKSIATYFKGKSENSKDLARMIFTWVALNIKYDDDAFNNAIYRSPEPDSVLAYRKAVCAGYSLLFKAICNEANIEVISIDGFAKGYGFKKGMPVNGTNHSWNAVKYDDSWHLMDVTWGSGFAETIDGKAVSKSKFCDYYFDVPPIEFIFNHFPDSTQHQFLNKNITREQFKRLLVLDAHCVFKMGFSADTIFAKSRANENFSLPDIFCSDSISFSIVKGPYNKVLRAGSTQYFEIKNYGSKPVVILNNNELIEFDFISDKVFSKTLTKLKAGEIKIGIANEDAIEIYIIYDVR